jgi:hypothetical protein
LELPSELTEHQPTGIYSIITSRGEDFTVFSAKARSDLITFGVTADIIEPKMAVW